LSRFSLVARNFGVRIRGRSIVQGVDLQLSSADRVAIVGRSGSGKSTLARALVGLETDLEGSLRIHADDRDVELVGAKGKVWGAVHGSVQLCWQDGRAALDPRLDVARSVSEARALAGLPALDERGLAELLTQVDLEPELVSRFPDQLSGGQCQRVALARALSTKPALLIADEVTSELDRARVWQIVELLRRVHDEGCGLLMITHDLSLLSDLVEEVIVLDGGRVVERGPWARLLSAPEHVATRDLVGAIDLLPDPPTAPRT
jgi:peptide/nickel transport system ATP-binding protein